MVAPFRGMLVKVFTRGEPMSCGGAPRSVGAPGQAKHPAHASGRTEHRHHQQSYFEGPDPPPAVTSSWSNAGTKAHVRNCGAAATARPLGGNGRHGGLPTFAERHCGFEIPWGHHRPLNYPRRDQYARAKRGFCASPAKSRPSPVGGPKSNPRGSSVVAIVRRIDAKNWLGR